MHGARTLRLRSGQVSRILLALTVAAGLLPGVALAAPDEQSGNLLSNPGFEGSFESSGVATGWASWSVVFGTDCGNQQPTYQAITSGQDPRRVQEGSKAQQILISGSRSYQAGLQQTVYGITPGSRVRFTVYGHMWSSTGDNAAVSENAGNANMKVGIGQGETYAADQNITWSSLVSIHDNYQQLSVEAVAAGSVVTVFTYSNPSACNPHNETMWDNASLTVVSTGSSGAAPTSPPAAQSTTPPFLTAFPTPTPDAEGKVVYIVQPGDTLIGIAWTAGCRDMACVEQLKALNGMTTSSVYVGQRLILATGASAPVQPTAEEPTQPPEQATPEAAATEPGPAPAATEGEQLPAGTAVAGGEAGANVGSICVMLYDDANGDAVRNQGEGLVAGGVFTLADSSTGAAAGEYTTTGKVDEEPYCFASLPAGSYNVQVVPPEGYQTTTANSFALALQPGGKTSLEFGAQSTGAAAGARPSSSMSRVLLAVGGVVFLMLAAGVAGFLVLTRRR